MIVHRHRQLGNSDLRVSPVGFGCWPIAGISSLGINDADSLATIHAALDAGINFIDTAYSYGYDGEADKLLSQVLATRRSEAIVASKVGQFFNAQGVRERDGRPQALRKQATEILQRLGLEQVDIMYLHQVDPLVPVEESAAGIAELVTEGLTRYAGVSNVTAAELATFHSVCPVTVVQPPFNMLQQQIVEELRPFCEREQISMACYWVLMKGLLAGKLKRQHEFDPRDKRLSYPVFQGQAWQQSQDFLDRLRGLAVELEITVAQLVIAWTLQQPQIDVALCGAKRPAQIQETAQAMQLVLSPEILERIDGWISEMPVLA